VLVTLTEADRWNSPFSTVGWESVRSARSKVVYERPCLWIFFKIKSQRSKERLTQRRIRARYFGVDSVCSPKATLVNSRPMLKKRKKSYHIQVLCIPYLKNYNSVSQNKFRRGTDFAVL